MEAKRKGKKGTDKGNKGKGSRGTKSLPRTQGTDNCWECGKTWSPRTSARECRSIATVGEGETGKDDWTWKAQEWDAQQPEPETGSTFGGLWLRSFGGQANGSNPHLVTVTFRVDSGAEETVLSLDTASDYPRERGPQKAMRDYAGKPVKRWVTMLHARGSSWKRVCSRTCCQLQHLWTLDTKSRSRKSNRTCDIRRQDGGKTSAASEDRTPRTSHWKCARGHQESRNGRYQAAQRCSSRWSQA